MTAPGRPISPQALLLAAISLAHDLEEEKRKRAQLEARSGVPARTIYRVLNGIDQRVWNPAADPEIPAAYSVDSLAGKRRCRSALQRAFGLRARARTPFFAMTARLVSQ